MKVELHADQLNKMSKLERANIYANFVLDVDLSGKWFLNHCFGADFCKMIDTLIDFNLYENGKKFEDIERIKFYECQSGRKTKTIISRIKFKQ